MYLRIFHISLYREPIDVFWQYPRHAHMLIYSTFASVLSRKNRQIPSDFDCLQKRQYNARQLRGSPEFGEVHLKTGDSTTSH